jgi:Arrestin (or S-antigen), C-terminal domain/Arrestin (or S-antigen), N-terminal domain
VGEAKCLWTGYDYDFISGRRRFKTYRGSQKLMNYESYLFGSANSDFIEIPRGIHEYDFVTKSLPDNIPESVDEKHGVIFYKVEVNLDIPWAYDLQAKKPFTVIRHEDISRFPELALPVEVEGTETFCCSLFSGPLIIRARLPKTGFALGEKIPVQILLNNKSSIDVNRTVIALNRIDKFKETQSMFQQDVKTIKSTVRQETFRKVMSGETVAFKVFLKVPEVFLTSNSKYCEVFQISYEIYIKVKTSGCTVSPTFHVPIAIGTIGFADSAVEIPQMQVAVATPEPAPLSSAELAIDPFPSAPPYTNIYSNPMASCSELREFKLLLLKFNFLSSILF